MLFYIAFIAIVNLMLGYALAVYTGASRRRVMVVAAARPQPLASYETGDPYASDAYDSEPTDAIGEVDTDYDYEAPAAESMAPPQVEDSPLIDATTGLKTRSHFQQLLRWRATAADAADTQLTVALLELDRPTELDRGVDNRLLHSVASTVRQLIAESQTAVRYSDNQFLLLLDNDDFGKASERAEQVRQWIEATEFVADGWPVPATLTCALLETTAAEPEERLVEQLGEALKEARRSGGNCTFRHDGTAVTPVAPMSLNVERQKCHL